MQLPGRVLPARTGARQTRAPIRSSGPDQQAARELASELGGLPLTACDGRSHIPAPGTTEG
jgi:hypothetical protein